MIQYFAAKQPNGDYLLKEHGENGFTIAVIHWLDDFGGEGWTQANAERIRDMLNAYGPLVEYAKELLVYAKAGTLPWRQQDIDGLEDFIRGLPGV
jgi:hypothetical protein